MKELIQDNEIAGYELENNLEVETLKLSINTFIKGVLLNDELSLKVRSLKFLESYLIASEMVNDLDKGVRILASESDYFLSETSLRYFSNYFTFCTNRNILKKGADDISISEDKFIISAITSYSMLKVLPKTIDDSLK